MGHRSPVTRKKLLAFLFVGFVAGLGLGFVFMGTLHAVSGAAALRRQPYTCRVSAAMLPPLSVTLPLPPHPYSVSCAQFIEIGASKHHHEGQSAAEQQALPAAVEQKGGTAATVVAAAGGASGWPTTGETVHIAYTSNGSPYTNYQVCTFSLIKFALQSCCRRQHHNLIAKLAAACCHPCLPLLPASQPASLYCAAILTADTISQNLVMYGTYKLAQKMPGGDKMVGFTRILHRTTHDALSPRVPTFLATPLHPGALAAGSKQWAAYRRCQAAGSSGLQHCLPMHEAASCALHCAYCLHVALLWSGFLHPCACPASSMLGPYAPLRHTITP
jgi:hypothetical protein